MSKKLYKDKFGQRADRRLATAACCLLSAISSPSCGVGSIASGREEKVHDGPDPAAAGNGECSGGHRNSEPSSRSERSEINGGRRPAGGSDGSVRFFHLPSAPVIRHQRRHQDQSAATPVCRQKWSPTQLGLCRKHCCSRRDPSVTLCHSSGAFNI